MQDFLVMRDFGKTSPPTLVAKVRRDADNMYHYARYVIVLDDNGKIIERINRVDSLGDFLVVLAPVVYKNQKLDLAVVLEIGFSRSVPYKQFEKWFDDERVNVQGRRPVAKLVDEKIVSLMPEFARAIQVVVDEAISHRRNLVYLTRITPNGSLAKRGVVRTIGKFITVPLDEEPLAFICLVKDIEIRTNGHLSTFVNMTKRRLKKFKYAYYPDREILRFANAKEQAKILIKANYPSFFAEIIRNKLGKETGKVRALFELIVEKFEINFRDSSDTDFVFLSLYKKWVTRESELKSLFPISVMRHTKREEKKLDWAKEQHGHTNFMHAKNCVRIEIMPSKEAIKAKHEFGDDGLPILNLSKAFMNREQ